MQSGKSYCLISKEKVGKLEGQAVHCLFTMVNSDSQKFYPALQSSSDEF